MSEEKQTATTTATKDFKDLPLKERTTIKDIDDKNRQLNITQKDGKAIEVTITQPSFRQAEAIDDARTEIAINDDGENGTVRTTTPRFHQALFAMYSAVLVDNKPAGKFNWDFLETLDRETARWLLNEGATFLGGEPETAE